MMSYNINCNFFPFRFCLSSLNLCRYTSSHMRSVFINTCHLPTVAMFGIIYTVYPSMHCYRPIALTSQILRVSSRCSTISVRVQQPDTAQKLTILIQNYYKVLQNLLCLQKLYYTTGFRTNSIRQQ
jgi:hypothetical protein